ncbi:MAG: SLC13 family permease [Planctomycetaceae bacterium]|nr:SLC13 family permease [Planctomycetaceae bacterium]
MTFFSVAPDIVLAGALSLLLVTGVVSVTGALEGFSNAGLITVAVLFAVAEGLRQTGGISFLGQRLLGQPKSVTDAQARVMFPTIVLSSFLNNTPVVAVLMPVLNDWCKKSQMSISKLLIPLSYAAILGGLCTRIGTSTTLVLDGILREKKPGFGLTMFEIAWVGIPVSLIGIIYVLTVQRWLLPERKPAISTFDDPREYTVEMLVELGSPLIGQTIGAAGLRNLPGMYLMEIDRDGHVLAAVSPEERLQANDRLVFVGVVESVVDLQRLPGLTPATDQVFKLDSPRSHRCLIEAVVSNTCPLINMTIREARFRTRYNAAVIAVARNGQRLPGKIGDITVIPGDTLLLEAHPSFESLQRNSRDFYLVSRIEDSTPPRSERAKIAQGVFVAMIVLVTVFQMPMLNASLLAAGILIVTRCVRSSEARRAIDWSVLITMAAGIGIGNAMEESGAAVLVANTLTNIGGANATLVLAMIYGVSMLFTNLITAKAAGVLILPIALAAADRLGVSIMPFAVAVMVASAASLATPIGYQTNLMVYGPGGYRYSDYLRIGGPLSLIIWGMSILIIPQVWPF